MAKGPPGPSWWPSALAFSASSISASSTGSPPPTASKGKRHDDRQIPLVRKDRHLSRHLRLPVFHHGPFHRRLSGVPEADIAAVFVALSLLAGERVVRRLFHHLDHGAAPVAL